MKKYSKNVMLKHEASLNEYNEERIKNCNTVLGTKSKLVPSMYHPLFEKLQNLKFYQYIIISPDDIDKCYGNNISLNESADARSKRRGRFRKNMVFPNLSYSFYSWYMGNNRAMYMVLWKVPSCESDRKEDELIQCVYQSTNKLPLIGNRKKNFYFLKQI